MKRLLAPLGILVLGSLLLGPTPSRAADSLEGKAVHHDSGSAKPSGGSSSAKATQADADGDNKPVGGKSGEKGGIYVVGRGFKTAGSEMEKGFKAAGRGIAKGGKATGHAFKKAGHSIKNFFTGETDDSKKK